MAARLAGYKPRRVLRALLRAGFYIHHQAGSHVQLRHPRKSHLRVTVPRHDQFELPTQIVRSILRQAGMSEEEFLDLV